MSKCNVILVKHIRKFYDNNGNIYDIYKKKNNHVYLTITNKLVFNKIIAEGQNNILSLLKIKYKDTKFSNSPILDLKEYQY